MSTLTIIVIAASMLVAGCAMHFKAQRSRPAITHEQRARYDAEGISPYPLMSLLGMTLIFGGAVTLALQILLLILK